MEIQEITNLILNSGTTIVILAYFIYRDFKFMDKLDTTLQCVLDAVDALKKEK